MDEILKRFKNVDRSSFPDFDLFKEPLGRALWVLLVAKQSDIAKQLTAPQISLILLETLETNVEIRPLINALNRAKNKIHVSKTGKEHFYTIMKDGMDVVLSVVKKDSFDLVCFESGKKYQSKRILSTQILDNLKGDLKIVDPYCGERTLDILHSKKRSIKFLTRLENIKKDKDRLLRAITEFRSENPSIEFRDYVLGDHMHDRYIISDNAIVLLGYSMHSLGNKESFAISLSRTSSLDIAQMMIANFDRRWKESNPL